MDSNLTVNFTPLNVSLYTTVPQWTKSVQILIMVLIAVLGIPGNCLIVVVQTKLREKSSTDYLVLGMAVLDLCGSVFVTSIYIALNLETVWITIASDFVCQVQYFLVYWANISSTFLFAALAFDRYMRTCHPFCLWYSSKKAVFICVGSLLVGLCLASMSFPLYALNKRRICYKREYLHFVNIIMNTSLTAAFVLMFIIGMICYFNVTLRLRERNRDKMRIKRELLASSNQTVISKWHKRNKVVPEPKPQPLNSHSTGALTTNQSLVIECIQSITEGGNSAANNSSSTGKAGTSEELKDSINTVWTPSLQKVQYKKSQVFPTTTVETARQRETLEPTLTTQGTSKSFDRRTYRQDSQNTCNEPVFSPILLPVGDVRTNSISRVVNITPDINQLVYNDDALKKLEKEQRKVNYVTLMMFIITLTYILSWVVNWITFAVIDPTTAMGAIVIYLIRTSFVLNYVTNAFFYILMSSKFRATAKSMLLNCLK